MFTAMEDVMGTGGLNTLLSLAGLDAYIAQPPPNTLGRQFDFVCIAALNQALEDMYGARGGRGMALRVGRACFARGMKNFGAMAGMTDPAFVALPLPTRARLGLDALAAIFTNFSDQYSTVADQADYLVFTTEVSPMAWGRSSDKPVCHMLTGMIQESLRWASDGYEFHAQEIACRAAGDAACVFRVSKKPMGQMPSKEA
ncbi:MAG: 4-vinyl reductase [Armatimonadetes bacterium]|nr:4-vinyl reductase [Anaerolineae bacterium]